MLNFMGRCVHVTRECVGDVTQCVTDAAASDGAGVKPASSLEFTIGSERSGVASSKGSIDVGIRAGMGRGAESGSEGRGVVCVCACTSVRELGACVC